MTIHTRENLKKLDKGHLIYLIEQFYRSEFLISEVCVDESKKHIDSETAIRKIREYIYDMPSMYNFEELKANIEMKMGKITPQEYRKIIGLE